jgi:Tat protein secretion system quality control protein TatD with DNase activity
VYFGFAPVVNFRSPKTADVIRKVGLERLVLETDHEDAGRVLESMEQGIDLISEALNESRETVIDRTTQNAFDLYGLGIQQEV